MHQNKVHHLSQFEFILFSDFNIQLKGEKLNNLQ